MRKSKQGFAVILLAFVLMVLLFGYLTTPDEGVDGETRLVISHHYEYHDIEELVSASDAIIIGQVGEVVATDYPRRRTSSQYTDEELTILGGEDYIEKKRNALHQISVEETLKGSIPDQFILIRADVEHYFKIDLTRLEEGERLLFFVHSSEKLDDRQTYRAFADNGLFDLDGNNAFPRAPIAFREDDYKFYNQDSYGAYGPNDYDVQNWDPNLRPF